MRLQLNPHNCQQGSLCERARSNAVLSELWQIFYPLGHILQSDKLDENVIYWTIINFQLHILRVLLQTSNPHTLSLDAAPIRINHVDYLCIKTHTKWIIRKAPSIFVANEWKRSLAKNKGKQKPFLTLLSHLIAKFYEGCSCSSLFTPLWLHDSTFIVGRCHAH